MSACRVCGTASIDGVGLPQRRRLLPLCLEHLARWRASEQYRPFIAARVAELDALTHERARLVAQLGQLMALSEFIDQQCAARRRRLH